MRAIAWLFVQVSYKEPFLYLQHAILLSEDTPSSIPHIVYALGVFSLEVGRRHQVHIESNEGGIEKHKSSEEEGGIIQNRGIWKTFKGEVTLKQRLKNWKRFDLEINIWGLVLEDRKKAEKVFSLKSYYSEFQPFKIFETVYWNDFPGL